MLKNRHDLYILLFILLVSTLWVGLFFLLATPTKQLSSTENGCDLTGLDLENTLYVTPPCWESWPGKLYEPDELNAAEPSVPQGEPDYTRIQYATHRLRLTLPPGAVYGLSLYSTDYSMRLYIGGAEMDVVGYPGTTRTETIPQMRDGVYYFKASDEPTEIVVQSSNFVHKIGCRPPVLTIGTADRITAYARNQNLKTGLIFGCLITACLYHLAIFIIDRRRRASLFFSLSCLLLAYISKDFPALLFTEYNWFVAIRLEYLACILAAAGFALVVHTLFPASLHKWVLYTYLISCGIYCIIVVAFDSVIFSRLLPAFQFISSIAIIYGIIRLLMTLRNKKLTNLLAFLGIAILGLSIIIDFMQNSTVSAIGYSGIISVGMISLVFCYTIILSVEDTYVRQRLHEVSRNEQEIRETNRMLERLNRAKTDFLGDISHEMKTPLAVISNCAGITLQQFRQNALTAETEQNLDDMQHEAVRLGKLVDQLLAVSMEKERQLTLTDTHAEVLLQQAAKFCAMICQGRKNQIVIDAGPEHIPLRVNPDSIFQVLVNLITNANRQTENEIIRLSVQSDGNQAVFRIRDHGGGIPPAILEKVFERGVSGDGGNGLGLSICKEIVREHGGEITIHSSRDGTTVQFTLPCHKGEDK